MDIVKINTPGRTDFSLKDRIAIKDVLAAFSSYWDSRQLVEYIDLFTDDANLLWGQPEGTETKIPLEQIRTTAVDRFKELESSGIQQRHLAANPFFISQEENSAQIEQYVLLTITENMESFQTQFTMVYMFWLVKNEGRWLISKFRATPDVHMNVPTKKEDS